MKMESVYIPACISPELIITKHEGECSSSKRENPMRLLIFICSLLFCMQVQSGESTDQTFEDAMIKVYVTLDQIHLTDGKIMVKFSDVELETSQLNSDEDGLFVYYSDTIKAVTCGFGHEVWCWLCKGCAVRYCKGRCKHVTWE
jgi:hypothetical protein